MIDIKGHALSTIEACNRGDQRCSECPLIECGDNTSPLKERLKELEREAAGVPHEDLEGVYIISYWQWPPTELLMKSMKPVAFASNKIELKAGFKAYCCKGVSSCSVFDMRCNLPFWGRPVVQGTLYFIDQQPEANWAHPCIYILVRS